MQAINQFNLIMMNLDIKLERLKDKIKDFTKKIHKFNKII